jgi:hypothetical protein
MSSIQDNGRRFQLELAEKKVVKEKSVKNMSQTRFKEHTTHAPNHPAGALFSTT